MHALVWEPLRGAGECRGHFVVVCWVVAVCMVVVVVVVWQHDDVVCPLVLHSWCVLVQGVDCV